MKIRTFFAVLLCKLARGLLRLLRRGSGPKPFKHGKTKPITEADWSIITRQPLPAEDLTPRAKGKPSQGYGQGAGQRPRQ